MRGGVKVDKIITSPPYNIIRPNATDRGYDIYNDGMTNEEYAKWNVEIFTKYDNLLSENGCVIYNLSYGTENTEVMNRTVYEIIEKTNFTIADILVWKKKSAIPNNVSCNKMTRICEFVYVFCRRNEFNSFKTNKRMISNRSSGQPVYENVFNFFVADNNDASTDLNKATFSTEFVNEIINRYVTDTDVVLDNFCGTGTTLYACSCRNIKAIGIELSKNQCEYAKQRIESGCQLDLMNFLK